MHRPRPPAAGGQTTRLGHHPAWQVTFSRSRVSAACGEDFRGKSHPPHPSALKPLYLQIWPCVPEGEQESWIKNSFTRPGRTDLHAIDASNLGSHPFSQNMKLTTWQTVAEKGHTTRKQALRIWESRKVSPESPSSHPLFWPLTYRSRDNRLSLLTHSQRARQARRGFRTRPRGGGRWAERCKKILF